MIIFLNAPPRAGKDTCAEIMKRLVLGMGEFKMSAVLKTAIADLFGLDHPRHQWAEKNKDTKSKMFGHEIEYSYREIQIMLSEEFMKPNFGQDIFGRIAVRRLTGIMDKTHFVISDVGFDHEVVPIIRGLASKHEIRLLKITRPGCDFSNDSRNWIHGADIGIREDTINNRHDLELYEEQIKIWLRSVKLLPKAG